MSTPETQPTPTSSLEPAMPRPRLAFVALALAAALTGCGKPADRTPGSDTSAVVKERAPEPTCAPADATSDTPPEPDLSGDQNGDDVNDIRRSSNSDC